MLNKEALKGELEIAFMNTIPNAVERAWLEALPKSDEGDKLAKKFGETLSQYLAQNWAMYLSEAIDSYIKNIELYGEVMTTGSPTNQVAMINCIPTPSINGSLPNTLGIR